MLGDAVRWQTGTEQDTAAMQMGKAGWGRMLFTQVVTNRFKEGEGTMQESGKEYSRPRMLLI